MAGVPLQSNVVRSLRLSAEELSAVLDRLDAVGPGGPGDKRAEERFSFRPKRCVASMQQPGGGDPLSYLVAARNLGAGGVGFLLGGFVHRGTRCTVQLVSAHGAWEDISGTVVDCRHIRDLVHEVHVNFDRQIDVGMYCPDAVKARVLLVEDDPTIVRLATTHLNHLNAQVVVVENGELAIQEAVENLYDVILMDIEMPVLNGLDATRQLRKRGYSGKIVAVTAMTGATAREACLNAGCDMYIPKPYTRDDLAQLLHSLHQEPLFSSMSGDASMADLIYHFTCELPAKLRELEQAFASGDSINLETLARRIKGEAGGFGFDPITASAQKLEAALQWELPNDRIKLALDDLVGWCVLARCPVPKSTPMTGAQSACPSGAPPNS